MYGHILCANSDTLAQQGLQLKVNGKRPKGLPKQLWLLPFPLEAGVKGEKQLDSEITNLFVVTSEGI